MHRLIFAISLCTHVVVACGSSPVPQPVPDFVRCSTHDLQQEELMVVGLPGAVAGEGKVHIKDRDSGATLVVSSTVPGTFSAVITAGKNADLVLQFENDDGKSEPLVLRDKQPVLPHPKLGPSTYGQVVSAPDGQGMVTVTNDDGPGKPLLLPASPDVDVIVTNNGTSEVATSRTDNTGRFTVKIAGQTGHAILIMLVDPKDPLLTSDFVQYQVP
jgi:hypothetical protein